MYTRLSSLHISEGCPVCTFHISAGALGLQTTVPSLNGSWGLELKFSPPTLSTHTLIPFFTLTHWNESALDIFAATLDSGHTLVIIQHIARLTEAACIADGRDFGAGALAVPIGIQAGG